MTDGDSRDPTRLTFGEGGGQPPGATRRPGDRVDRYEILSVEGTGGMGVVYRARDTVLEREVALKCPWGALANHELALRRFAREARAAARLSHPNIVQVHEVLEHDGLPWLSLQLVRGKSLAALLAEGGTPSVERIVSWAVELSSALDHAHRNDVLHRDIKPGNVLITDDGRALLTDFGLARPLTPSEATETRATVTRDITQEGHLVGTPAYMSPEQVLGRPLDRRSDLFSLGAVLYEACTGRPLVVPGTTREIREALNALEPPAIRELNPAVPRELERIVRKALARRPAERYATAGEMHDALAELQRRLVRRAGRLWLALAGAAAVALAAAVGISLYLGRSRPAPPDTGEIVAAALVTWPSAESGPRLSPDGASLSFVSDREGGPRVWARPLAGTDARPLTPPEVHVESHVWSPDGEEIAYTAAGADGLRLVFAAALDGTVRSAYTLGPELDATRLIRWIGGDVYAETGSLSLYRIGAATGEVSELMRYEESDGLRFRFDVRPDGERVAYTLRRGLRCTIWISALDGSQAEQVTPGGHCDSNPLWLGADGSRLVYTSTRAGLHDLWRIDLPQGPPRRITLSAAEETARDSTADGSLLVYEERVEEAHLWLRHPDSRPARQLTADALNDWWPSVDPVSGLVAFQRDKPRLDDATDLFGSQIFVGRIADERLVQSARTAGDGTQALLSPGGTWLAYVVGLELWVRDLATDRDVRVSAAHRPSAMLMFPHTGAQTNAAWHPKRPEIYFVESTETEHRLRVFDAGSGDTVVRTLRTTGGNGVMSQLAPSPDGARLAYVARGREGHELRVMALDTGVDRELWSAAGMLRPAGWLDERTLLAASGTPGPDGTQTLRLTEVRLDGRAETLGSIERALGPTLALDPPSRSVRLTVVDDDGVQNIVAAALDGTVLARLTDNQVPDVAFARTEPGPGGSFVWVRHRRTLDVWSIEFKDR